MVNMKYSLLLRGILRIKPVSQSVDRCYSIVYIKHGKPHLEKKLHGLSPRANYTDRATAACQRSDCQLLRVEGATA
jgi:hypothetical protein